jgi:hypothetical protein
MPIRAAHVWIRVTLSMRIPYPPGAWSGVSGEAAYTNVNPAIPTMWMSRAVLDCFGLVSVTAAASPPTATQVLTLPGPVGSRALVTTEVGNAPHARQIVSQYISGTDASYGLDLDATLLPWLGKPTFDAASGKILVPTDTTGTTTAAPDAVSLTASYRRTDPGTGAMTTFSWTLFSPVVADVTLPNLPLEVGNVMPTRSRSSSTSWRPTPWRATTRSAMT